MTRQSHAFETIPVVDISDLYSSDQNKRLAVAGQMASAASSTGFLYIRGHRIPPVLINNLLSSTRRFFAQPYEHKMQHYIGRSQNHSGYVPEGEEQFYSGKVDHKEAWDVGYELTDLSLQRPMLGPNQWPQDPQFRQHVSAYYDAALNLGRLLFRGFALGLGLPEQTFDSKVINPPSQLRLVHYPFNPDASDREGIGAHTDYECFTLLLPTCDGLEVLNGNGQWIDAPVIPGCLVVNIGDMLEVLSNGRFIATSHRVRKVKEERYSFPLFCSCDYDTVIEPLLEPAPGVAAGRYQPLVCGDHLYAQTIQTFRYLRQRLDIGSIKMPDSSQQLASFGKLREAVSSGA
jgi:isopenicillin N synthase-like dioxygenase